MIGFVARHFVQAAVVLLAVALIAFIMVRYVGDPVANLLGPEATAADRAEARDRMGLDRPVVEQFVNFVRRAITGEFGISYRYSQNVVTLILERLPATLELAVTSVALAVIVGFPLGIYTAINPDTVPSRVVMTVGLVGASLPTFLVGILLIHLFASHLRILPTFGRGEVIEVGWWSTGFLTLSGVKSLVLPAITLALFYATLIMRLVRVEMLDILQAEYIRFARARGIKSWSIYFRHALKNTLVPLTAVIGLQFGVLISFSIVTESVFQWPGVGLLFISAVQFADIPLISSYLVLVAVIFVSVNMLADLICSALDPRWRSRATRRNPA